MSTETGSHSWPCCRLCGWERRGAYLAGTWFGFFAPKATPREIISRLNAAAVEALADPALRSRFIDLGLEIFPRERQTPEALGALQRSDAEKWWPRIKEFGIKAE